MLATDRIQFAARATKDGLKGGELSERERDRQTDRQTQTDTDRQTGTDRQTDRQRRIRKV